MRQERRNAQRIGAERDGIDKDRQIFSWDDQKNETNRTSGNCDKPQASSLLRAGKSTSIEERYDIGKQDEWNQMNQEELDKK